VRVLAALSGGVDSSVAAAVLLAEGHDVVAVTMKLWGGAQDSGCCSVGDVEDARRVAQQLGIAHHVFNFTDEFDMHVVAPYADAHAAGRTPNPCVDCNRHLKFDRLVDATGTEVGRVPAIELITVGQRRGLGGGARERQYAVAVDVPTRTVRVGGLDELGTARVELDDLTWTSGGAPRAGAVVTVQASAHGPALAARWDGEAVCYDRPARRPAPGQALVVYDGDEVLGGGTVR